MTLEQFNTYYSELSGYDISPRIFDRLPAELFDEIGGVKSIVEFGLLLNHFFVTNEHIKWQYIDHGRQLQYKSQTDYALAHILYGISSGVTRKIMIGLDPSTH